jgi:hypothetical protein
MELTHEVLVPEVPDSTVALYRLKSNGWHIGSLMVSPTGNCQLNSYRFFEKVLDYNIKFNDFVTKYSLLTERKIMLVDIKKHHLQSTKEWCGEGRIVAEMPYTSTNDSEMVILLIKIK